MKREFSTCHVYRRPENFLFFGIENTPYGGITLAPAHVLRLAASPNEIGETVVEVLNSGSRASAFCDLSSARKGFLDCLKQNGFKTVDAFERKADLVAVHYDGVDYEIVPHRKVTKGGFLALDPMPQNGLSAKELGLAVMKALDAVRSLSPVDAD